MRSVAAKARLQPRGAALCEVLECQPGDLPRWKAEGGAG